MNKVWFVTGASSGIGMGVVKGALEAGDRATARNVEKLRAAVGQPANDRLALIPLDVTSENQAHAAVAAAVEKFGRIDVLVNNAGYSLLGNFETVTTEQIERQFATNAAIKAQWDGYHGTQSGDPAKLGTAIVKLANMESPPKQFFAGSDAVGGITADLKARLEEVDVHKQLSSSTDGSF